MAGTTVTGIVGVVVSLVVVIVVAAVDVVVAATSAVGRHRDSRGDDRGHVLVGLIVERQQGRWAAAPTPAARACSGGRGRG
jgi:hypothetical protein